MAYVRTVKTKSGATAVQIVWSSRRGARSIEHVGSAHDAVELAALNTAAARRLIEGQQTLDFDVGGPLEIVSSRMAHLWDGLYAAYSRLGFDRAADGDDVFRDLVLARIIEPTRLRTFSGVDGSCRPLNWRFDGRQADICTLNLGSWGAVVAYMRTVKTSSGATAVQIVWSTLRGSRQIKHLGSAHNDSDKNVLTRF